MIEEILVGIIPISMIIGFTSIITWVLTKTLTINKIKEIIVKEKLDENQFNKWMLIETPQEEILMMKKILKENDFQIYLNLNKMEV